MGRGLESYSHRELQELAQFALTSEGTKILDEFIFRQIAHPISLEPEFVPTDEVPTPDRFYNVRIVRPADSRFD